MLFEKVRGVTDVVIQRDIAHISVQLAKERMAGERLELLQAFATENIPLFLVKLLPSGLSFAVRGVSLAACETLLTERKVKYTLLADLAVVSTIAGAMRDLSGVMAGIYEALIEAEVRVQQTGDAYNAVHCLVAGTLADQARKALKDRFALREAGEEASAAEALAREAAEGSSGLKAL